MEVTRSHIIATLKEHGAVLQRANKHEVWKFPNGQCWTLPLTPSCSHAWANNLHDLRRHLGLTPKEASVGVRRERRKRQRATQPRWKGFQPAFIEKRGFDVNGFRASLPTAQMRSEAGHFARESVYVSPWQVVLKGVLSRVTSLRNRSK